MLSRKIIVQNITNLTDARYFAAWGVDYLCYNINADSDYHVTYDKVKEISGWVEGPKTLVESSSLEFLEGVDGNILDDMYSSLPLTKEAFFRTSLSEVKKGLPNGNYIIKIKDSDLAEINALDNTQLLGCTVFLDITELDFKYLKEIPDYGLIVQGGEEEKVGVKSYDDLDLLYEWLLE